MQGGHIPRRMDCSLVIAFMTLIGAMLATVCRFTWLWHQVLHAIRRSATDFLPGLPSKAVVKLVCVGSHKAKRQERPWQEDHNPQPPPLRQCNSAVPTGQQP